MAALAASRRARPEEMAILIVATGGQRSGEKWEAKASFRIAEMNEGEGSESQLLVSIKWFVCYETEHGGYAK